MAQKVNPIAVRMKFNRFSDSSWFSDYYYSTLLYQDLNFRQYLNSIKQPNANKLGFRTAKCIIHHFPKRSLIHLFCLSDPRPYQMENTYATRKARSDNTRMLEEARTVLNQGAQRLQRALVLQPEQHRFAPQEIEKILAKARTGGGALGVASLSRVLETNFCGPEESPFWFNSSIFHKKKALINLYRGVNVRSRCWTYLFLASRNTRNRPLATLIHRAYRGVRKNKNNSTLVTGAKRSGCEANNSNNSNNNSDPASLYTDNHPAAANIASNTYWREALNQAKAANFFSKGAQRLLPGVSGQARSKNYYFNLYAMHYFFMQKTNHFYEKECFALLKATNVGPNSSRMTWFGSSILTGPQFRMAARPGTFEATGGNSAKAPLDLAASAATTSYHASRRRTDKGREAGRCAPSIQISKSLDFYLFNVQFRLSQNTNTFISLRPIKISSVFQCASLVAQEIACKLEQKKSFRLICRLIFQQLAACKYIKGIRITCSGRLNGAEIAKTECRKNGETSLHVFSDKIDYARSEGKTPYGILGVKVWISYI
jgi:ribosomal protein S3